MDNPFLNRGSLAGLIAKRNQVNSTMEGASPFNAFMARKKARQVDEAINQFGNAAIRRPMPQAPMAPRPMAAAAQPMRPPPMLPAAPAAALPSAFGNVGPATGGTGSTVTISGGGGGGWTPPPMPQAPQQQMPQMPAQGGGWNALGLGNFDPRMFMMGGNRGFGYGGYGQGFQGFGGAQPYRPTPAGGFAGLF